MSQTIFSKIIAGDSESSQVYKDELVTAFLDIDPVNPGHTLVVPNVCIPSLSELDDETGARMFNVARSIAAAIKKSTLECEGINLVLADGEVAGQEVFHTHIHVIPRNSKDSLVIQHDRSSIGSIDRVELDRIARKIRHEIERTV